MSHHHQNQLHLIAAGLLRSEPQLAARLSVFGRLSAGEAMPAWEQVSSRQDRIRQRGCLDRGDDQRRGRGHLPLPQGGPRPGRRRLAAQPRPTARATARTGTAPGAERAADRTRRPGLTADEHRHRPCPPVGRPQSGAATAHGVVLAGGAALGAKQAGTLRALGTDRALERRWW
jgi:hypothetical protein